MIEFDGAVMMILSPASSEIAGSCTSAFAAIGTADARVADEPVAWRRTLIVYEDAPPLTFDTAKRAAPSMVAGHSMMSVSVVRTGTARDLNAIAVRLQK